MRLTSYLFRVAAVLAISAASTGCESQQAANEQQPIALSGPPPAIEQDHDHSHGDEHRGPHDGHVIELGRNHEYHAEIVEDDERELVTVYILGKDMKELSIDANMLTMSLMVDGTPRTFELAAASASGGNTSRYDGADVALFEALHEHEASGKLRATINGTPYVANFEHHDHGQDHDDEDGHDHDDHDHGDGHSH